MSNDTKKPWMHRRAGSRGSVMVEFAIVCVLFYLMLAALLTFGRALMSAQVLQQTADVMARELSRTAVEPEATLDEALEDAGIKQELFDETKLRADITGWLADDQGKTLVEYLQQDQGWPIINRLLIPLMIMDRQGAQTFLTYPGIQLDAGDGHYYVSVIRSDGSIARVRVVEPAGTPDPFPLDAARGGLAAVRLNYPYQSGSLSAMVPGAGGMNEFVRVPDGEALDLSPTQGGLYGGTDGLGQQVVGPLVVRPFQRLLSGQAVYRREVFR
jgi:hypothetical protein